METAMESSDANLKGSHALLNLQSYKNRALSASAKWAQERQLATTICVALHMWQQCYTHLFYIFLTRFEHKFLSTASACEDRSCQSCLPPQSVLELHWAIPNDFNPLFNDLSLAAAVQLQLTLSKLFWGCRLCVDCVSSSCG